MELLAAFGVPAVTALTGWLVRRAEQRGKRHDLKLDTIHLKLDDHTERLSRLEGEVQTMRSFVLGSLRVAQQPRQG